jgi:hypothetical protein
VEDRWFPQYACSATATIEDTGSNLVFMMDFRECVMPVSYVREQGTSA